MEVIAQNCANHPVCPHGPCLMFERCTVKGTKSGRRFYACSACRDRSVCSYFQWVDDKISDQKKKHWDLIIKATKPPYSHEEFMKRLKTLKHLPVTERTFCKTCSLFILPEEKDNHKDHEKVFKVTDQQLQRPTELFQSIQNSKAEAQYFFSEKTVKFVVELLKNLGFQKLLLIGTPKIHEYINSSNISLSTLLLDIDHRYLQFLDPKQFCHYNLFNNHFFGGEGNEEKVKKFLNEIHSEKVAVLIDPPFGGLVDAIAYTLKTLNKWWIKENSKDKQKMFPLLWFFPYFMESKIIKNFSQFEMMDYKVDYSNHNKFGKKRSQKGSAVRIFTNIPASSFKLPHSEGYRLCKKCQKYVSGENVHCSKCNKCTTKHGKTYKHCDNCQRCVKSSFIHCDIHNKCSPKSTSTEDLEKTCACNPEQNEDNENEFERCFKCYGYGHRKRDCPTNPKKKKKMRRK